jgi:hypothetical protein
MGSGAQSGGSNALPIIMGLLAVILIAGGAAFYFVKFGNPFNKPAPEDFSFNEGDDGSIMADDDAEAGDDDGEIEGDDDAVDDDEDDGTVAVAEEDDDDDELTDTEAV